MEKVIDIADRIPTLRKKRRRRSNMKFIILISLFFGTLFLLLYFQSPYSDIKKITIIGSNAVNSEEYLAQSKLKIGQSMWSFRKSDIEENLRNLDWVKTVDVDRKWLTTVEIKIDEWKKVAYISKDQSFYPMLENGTVLTQSSTTIPIDAPIFINFKDDNIRKKLVKELGKLDSEVLTLISQINANSNDANPYSITLFMNDGYEVRADINSLAEKMKYYPSIIAQIESTDNPKKGIIDIEVGSYYRPYSDEYSDIDLQLDESAKGEDVEKGEVTKVE